MTQRLADSLSGNFGEIRTAEYRETWVKSDVQLEEYDFYLRGHDLFYRYTPKDNAKAREIWLKGLNIYPDSGLLKIKLGWSYMIEVITGWNTDVASALEKATTFMEEGLADEALPQAGLRAGLWLQVAVNLRYHKDCEATVRNAKNVVERYKFDVESLMYMAERISYCGNTELADSWITTSVNRSPDSSTEFAGNIGIVRYMQHRYGEAVEALENTWVAADILCLIASSYVELGRLNEARSYIDKLKTDYPRLTENDIRTALPIADQTVEEQLIENLGKAGWSG